MKKNAFIGFGLAIGGGVAVIFSALLSLSMQFINGSLIQGASVIDWLIGNVTSDVVPTGVIVLYIIGIIFSLVNVVIAIVGMIRISNKKVSGNFLLVARLLSLMSFVAIISSFIALGVFLLPVKSIGYNFMGFGILVAILGTLLQIFGEFFVRNKERNVKTK